MSFNQILSHLEATEDALLSILSTGEEKALNSAEIERITGYNPRVQRLIVRSLRKKHVPVCSTSNGYFIADTDEDIQSSIRIIRSHILSETETIDNLIKCKDNIDNYRRYCSNEHN